MNLNEFFFVSKKIQFLSEYLVLLISKKLFALLYPHFKIYSNSVLQVLIEKIMLLVSKVEASRRWADCASC